MKLVEFALVRSMRSTARSPVDSEMSQTRGTMSASNVSFRHPVTRPL